MMMFGVYLVVYLEKRGDIKKEERKGKVSKLVTCILVS